MAAVVSFTSPYGNQQQSARNVPSLDKVLVPEADTRGRQLGRDGNLTESGLKPASSPLASLCWITSCFSHKNCGLYRQMISLY